MISTVIDEQSSMCNLSMTTIFVKSSTLFGLEKLQDPLWGASQPKTHHLRHTLKVMTILDPFQTGNSAVPLESTRNSAAVEEICRR